MRALAKTLRSFFRLCLYVLGELFSIASCLLRGRGARAMDHARALCVALHDDFLKGIVAVGRLWHRKPPRPTVDRILIVKLDRIGDMVLTTPVFDALRDAFPAARLDVVGHPASLTLLEGDDRIGERLAYRTWLYHALPFRPGSFRTWLLVGKLLWRRYPLVIYLRGSFPFLLLGLTSRLAAAKFVEGEQTVDRYLKPLEAFLGPISPRQPRLHVDAGLADRARKLLSQKESVGPKVVIHAAASSATKMWPAERFARVADQLAEHCQAEVHFLGTAEERFHLEKIADLASYPHSYHTQLRLPEVVAVLASCDLFIGNDSGLSHVAAAVGTREIVLWGPANLNMARPVAPPRKCTILHHELPCRATCPETYCNNPEPFECLTRIQTEDVVKAAEEHLASSVMIPLTICE
jgi:heptosyltransferase-2/heptosyltransferase-3